jgi:hypothetical protein
MSARIRAPRQHQPLAALELGIAEGDVKARVMRHQRRAAETRNSSAIAALPTNR